MEPSTNEAELAKLHEENTVVRPGECLACFLDRTIPKVGCRGYELIWRWNLAQPYPIPRIVEELSSWGGTCDCGVSYNVFDEGLWSGDARLCCSVDGAELGGVDHEVSGRRGQGPCPVDWTVCRLLVNERTSLWHRASQVQ